MDKLKEILETDLKRAIFIKEKLKVLDYDYAFWSGVVSRLEETLTEIKNL